jgi:hypothetical protein
MFCSPYCELTLRAGEQKLIVAVYINASSASFSCAMEDWKKIMCKTAKSKVLYEYFFQKLSYFLC